MTDWNEDQARGEKLLRKWAKRAALDASLGDELRQSGVTIGDVQDVLFYGTSTIRVRLALLALEKWLKDGGAEKW